MESKKVAIFSPNPQSLFTTSVCELLMRSGVEIEVVFVKKFTLARFKSEFSRDGMRLLKKIWKKLVLKGKAYDEFINVETILDYRKKENITLNNVNELVSKGTEVIHVEDLNGMIVENKLKERKIDLAVFTGGGLIRQNILRASGAGVLNCHMGKLPEYRGMDVVEWPLLKKDFDNLGFTVHFMDKGVDTGDILKVFSVPLLKNETIASLRARFEPIMTKNFAETIIGFLEGNIQRKEQRIQDGRQYYIIDQDLQSIAERNLIKHTS